MALALYRRYRPDTFEQVIGQDQVTVPLSRALDEHHLTHAYLFSGPRGCGKTSSARILARCMNCEQGPTSKPCGICQSCIDLAVNGSGSVDVVEIDAASHNGVDDARELRERAEFAPTQSRYKIFILDEAHMVTPQGFNALLKIVEEPPEHVVFIFATTEPDKVIGTIRSRTHHFPFRLVPPETMRPHLEQICAQEGVSVEPGVLNIVMRAGGGSMRDTLSILDQLITGSYEGTITYHDAVALLGFTPDELIGEAIDKLIERDGAGMYRVIQNVIVGGFDPRHFVEDLLARVRDLLLLLLSGDSAHSVLSDEFMQQERYVAHLQQQARQLGVPKLTAMAEVMNDTLTAMTGTIPPRMRLEILAARLLSLDSAVSVVQGSGVEQSSDVERRNAVEQSNGVERRRAVEQSSGVEWHSAVEQGSSAEQGSGVAWGSEASQERDMSQTAQQRSIHHEKNESAPAGSKPSSRKSSKLQDLHDVISSSAVGLSAPQGFKADTGTLSTASSLPDSLPSTSSASSVVSIESLRDQAQLDAQWDQLVNSLPHDVQELVNRKPVPSVKLQLGRNRAIIALTFDVPLSQHAFALAVASDGDNKPAQQVVLEAVRKRFGDHVIIAPAKTAANGEIVQPVSKMSAAEQQAVKRDILLAKTRLAGSNLVRGSARDAAKASGHDAGSDPANHSSADSSSAKSADDSDDDAADSNEEFKSGVEAANHGAFAYDESDWDMPIGMPGLFAASESSHPLAAPATAGMPDHAGQTRPSVSVAHGDSQERAAKAEIGAHEATHAADLHTSTHTTNSTNARETPSSNPYVTGSEYGVSDIDMHDSEQQQSALQDLDEDEYSFNDPVLHSDSQGGIDLLKRVFTVSKEWVIEPDDSNNPFTNKKNSRGNKGKMQ